jgi:hypothetical protein
MEYLMTYGWALLALFVVLVALVASGIFAPGRFTPQECYFQPELQCSPFILYRDSGMPPATTVLTFNVKNGFGFPVKFTNVIFKTTGIGPFNEYSDHPINDPDKKSLPMIPAGENYTITYTFDGEPRPPRGTSQKVIVNMEYLNCMNASVTDQCIPAALPIHYTSGRITATVEGN